VIDEADSVLIDDARVPLILSQTESNASELTALRRSLEIAGSLEIGAHVTLDATSMSATLAPEGRACIQTLVSGREFVWHNAAHLEESVCLALAALHVYRRDRHYFVREDKVELIDECTGRTASGRVWSRGLQQLVELKEGCTTSPRTQTVAQITYQRFFQRYLRLSGMSGTLREAGRELKAVYGLTVIEVPRHKADRRIILPTRVYPNSDAQWKAVVEQTRAVAATGRPVLIGTDSVLESEELSRFLTQAALPHRVLNARQDEHEASVIAAAGALGQITVTTNMAGRGTDIVVPNRTARIGGLHVICCQVNSSRRIDRQLMGRCGRRGDAGSTQRLISLNKPLIWRVLPRWITERVSPGGLEHPQWLVGSIISLAQWVEECRQRAQRRHLLRADVDAQNRMTFGKPIE
jgi:preprotein translocase subunit SecA